MAYTIDELTMLGRAYLSGANYLRYVARMNAINAKAIAAHNKKLRNREQSVAEIEAELERLQALLEKVKA